MPHPLLKTEDLQPLIGCLFKGDTYSKNIIFDMKVLWSISKNIQVSKLNTKNQCPCNLPLDLAREIVHMLLPMRSWSSSACKVYLHNQHTTSSKYTLTRISQEKGEVQCSFWTKHYHLQLGIVDLYLRVTYMALK